ncbi:DUF1289 domain-containing protein [Paracoccus contaminans]|uniref:DUF1289 domain-containing protein n=1 Tax=Paracoccus contaminans TaxID=1945662 RepID=A0A1W6CV83_9RHOB|nr:DUF1289 domain-containing protein [Paracoccus contaminans]ARJ68766.1 hypothetical protein B0A89_03085 [Paracoccus contaminans]
MTVASPCRNICQLDAARRLCLGCRRTIEEIGLWSRMSDAQRQAVLDRLAAQTRTGASGGLDPQPRL